MTKQRFLVLGGIVSCGLLGLALFATISWFRGTEASQEPVVAWRCEELSLASNLDLSGTVHTVEGETIHTVIHVSGKEYHAFETVENGITNELIRHNSGSYMRLGDIGWRRMRQDFPTIIPRCDEVHDLTEDTDGASGSSEGLRRFTARAQPAGEGARGSSDDEIEYYIADFVFWAQTSGELAKYEESYYARGGVEPVHVRTKLTISSIGEPNEITPPTLGSR